MIGHALAVGALATIATRAHAKAIVSNHCPYPVYAWSVPKVGGVADNLAIAPGGRYEESYRFGTVVNPGIAIKVSPSPNGIYNGTGELDFQYTVDPSDPTKVWINLAPVRGEPFGNSSSFFTCGGGYKEPYVPTRQCEVTDNSELVLCGGERKVPEKDATSADQVRTCTGPPPLMKRDDDEPAPRPRTCNARIVTPKKAQLLAKVHSARLNNTNKAINGSVRDVDARPPRQGRPGNDVQVVHVKHIEHNNIQFNYCQHGEDDEEAVKDHQNTVSHGLKCNAHPTPSLTTMVIAPQPSSESMPKSKGKSEFKAEVKHAVRTGVDDKPDTTSDVKQAESTDDTEYEDDHASSADDSDEDYDDEADDELEAKPKLQIKNRPLRPKLKTPKSKSKHAGAEKGRPKKHSTPGCTWTPTGIECHNVGAEAHAPMAKKTVLNGTEVQNAGKTDVKKAEAEKASPAQGLADAGSGLPFQTSPPNPEATRNFYTCSKGEHWEWKWLRNRWECTSDSDSDRAPVKAKMQQPRAWKRAPSKEMADDKIPICGPGEHLEYEGKGHWTCTDSEHDKHEPKVVNMRQAKAKKRGLLPNCPPGKYVNYDERKGDYACTDKKKDKHKIPVCGPGEHLEYEGNGNWTCTDSENEKHKKPNCLLDKQPKYKGNGRWTCPNGEDEKNATMAQIQKLAGLEEPKCDDDEHLAITRSGHLTCTDSEDDPLKHRPTCKPGEYLSVSRGHLTCTDGEDDMRVSKPVIRKRGPPGMIKIPICKPGEHWAISKSGYFTCTDSDDDLAKTWPTCSPRKPYLKVSKSGHLTCSDSEDNMHVPRPVNRKRGSSRKIKIPKCDPDEHLAISKSGYITCTDNEEHPLKHFPTCGPGEHLAVSKSGHLTCTDSEDENQKPKLVNPKRDAVNGTMDAGPPGGREKPSKTYHYWNPNNHNKNWRPDCLPGRHLKKTDLGWHCTDSEDDKHDTSPVNLHHAEAKKSMVKKDVKEEKPVANKDEPKKTRASDIDVKKPESKISEPTPQGAGVSDDEVYCHWTEHGFECDTDADAFEVELTKLSRPEHLTDLMRAPGKRATLDGSMEVEGRIYSVCDVRPDSDGHGYDVVICKQETDAGSKPTVKGHD